jgi:D-amino peptidase
MVTDMEGVDGVFDEDLQVTPNKSPRWDESLKSFVDEINAAVTGLLAGGATDVLIWDGHWSDSNLSNRDIHPRARLLTGQPISPTLELDASYSAVIFIGQHAMAGAENAILSHSYSFTIQNIWVNNKLTGEIGARTLLAGTFGIPVIMLAGDTAACKELRDLVPQAECAEVKSGVSRTAGFMLSHSAACELIQQKSKKAMERLPGFRPCKIAGPVEVKVEFTTAGTQVFRPREGVERLNDRTWVFRGKDILDARLKYSDF